jgi:transposase-like protein
MAHGGPDTHVEIDETLIGGVRKGTHNRGSHAKTVLIGAMERGGSVVTAVVPNQRRVTLQPFVESNVAVGGVVHTDELDSYRGLGAAGYRHATVNHGAEEYTYYDCRLAATVSVNTIEGFWRHLKCSIQGTHTSVSPKYLGRYAKEFEYRFNRRNRSESMLPELLSTFRPLTAKSRLTRLRRRGDRRRDRRRTGLACPDGGLYAGSSSNMLPCGASGGNTRFTFLTANDAGSFLSRGCVISMDTSSHAPGTASGTCAF